MSLDPGSISEGSFNSHEEFINYFFPKKKIILLPNERIASKVSEAYRRIEAKHGIEVEIWYPTPKDERDYKGELKGSPLEIPEHPEEKLDVIKNNKRRDR